MSRSTPQRLGDHIAAATASWRGGAESRADPESLAGTGDVGPTARLLERRGRRTRVPSLQCVTCSAPPYWPAGVDAILRSAGGEPVVLVPHSDSGLYIPAVIDALGDQVRGVVFVDAALPGAGYYAQRDCLNTLAGADGLLPPWTSWWEESDVAELFPHAEVQARVEAEQAPMPLAYYDHLPPAPDGWDRPRRAYIWFAEPDDIGAERGSAHAWPTRHVPGNHLHMLVDPDAVAAAVLEMADHVP